MLTRPPAKSDAPQSRLDSSDKKMAIGGGYPALRAAQVRWRGRSELGR
jgi:hypothetical protein